MIDSQRKAKINWHCRRGMLELDLILGQFSQKSLELLSDEQLFQFETLLQHPDPDLYAWLMGYEHPEDKELANIVTFIRFHDNVK